MQIIQNIWKETHVLRLYIPYHYRVSIADEALATNYYLITSRLNHGTFS